MAGRGRSSKYNDKIASEICDRIADGESLKSVCRDEGMPSPSSFLFWVNEDVNGLSARYARAREAQAEKFADELISIADDGSNDWMERKNRKGEIEIVLDREHVTRSQLRVETRKWVMSRILPKKYGPKVGEEAGGGDTGVTIVVKGGLPE